MVAEEGFSEKVTFEVGMGVSGEDIWKKSNPGRRVGRFKSLEAEAYLACVKSSNETSMAGVGEMSKRRCGAGHCMSSHGRVLS